MLDRAFIDVDREIERRVGQVMIDLYTALGEDRFRDLETQVVADACSGDGRVIALGAGSLLRPANQQCVSIRCLVVYLKLAPEQLWQRIRDDPSTSSTRPNLTGGGLDEVVTVLASRAPVYERCATLELDGAMSPPQLAQLIVQHLSSGRACS
jgi:shikimate kinase